MRRIVITVLLMALLSALSACGNHYVSRETVANVQLERDLKAIEDTRKALANLGVDIDDPESTLPNLEVDTVDSKGAETNESLNETQEQGSDDKRGKSPYNGKYNEVTFETYIHKLRDEDQSGEYYCMPGKVEEFKTFDKGIEYMILSVEFGFIAIAKISVVENWNKIKEGDLITVYFRHIGFLQYDEEYLSNYGEMPIGSYEYFEYYTD